jgi:hypothetical protein
VLFYWGKAMAITCELKEITPKDAQRLLLRNHKNQRSIRKHVVQRYADDMRRGLWMGENGETIKVADDGTVLDGQHRLTAIVESGIAITCLIVTGVFEDDITTIDAGATRKFSDALQMKGTHVKGLAQNCFAAVVRRLYGFRVICVKDIIESQRIGQLSRQAHGINFSNKGLQSFLNKNQNIERFAIECVRRFSITKIKPIVPISNVVSFWVVAREIDEESAYALIKTISDGYPFFSKNGSKDAALAVYHAFVKAKTQKKKLLPHQITDMLFYGFDKVMAGGPLQRATFEAAAESLFKNDRAEAICMLFDL